jgi:RimJ/RimL family protein N-acetyltransferase
MTSRAWHTRPVPGRTLTALRIDAGDVVLRKARDSDRDAIIAHASDPEVRAHLGGAQSRHDVARDLDEVGVSAVTGSPGAYLIADKTSDAFVGTMSLTRRGVHHPGHISPDGEELELAYTLSPPAWGRGWAFQAATAILRAAAAELPDEPVIIVTHSANARSLSLAQRLGFEPAMTFSEHGVQQTLAVVNLRDFARA